MDIEKIKEELLANIEKTETCWIWHGLTCQNLPSMILHNSCISIRKYIYLLNDSQTINKPNFLCYNSNCINPNHIISEDSLRFLTKIDKLNSANSCWLWTDGKNINGYGKFSIVKDGRRLSLIAHRYSWELHNNKKIPDGMFVCHSCDNPPCVNPEHLWLGTPADNSRDRDNKNRANTPRGSKKFMKLVEEQVLEIRKSNKSYKQLAEIFNVSHSTIYEILGRKTWKHI